MRGFDSCYSCLMIYLNLKSTRRTQHLKSTWRQSTSLSRFIKQVKTTTPKSLKLIKSQYTPLFTKNTFKKNLNVYFNLINPTNSEMLLPVYTGVISKAYSKSLDLVPVKKHLVFYNTPGASTVFPTTTIKPYNPKTIQLLTKTYFESLEDIHKLSTLISYFNSHHLVNRKYIQSKKASIIIAQVINSGHFSTRSVYLSSTQNAFLKSKIKLNQYLSTSVQPNILFQIPKLSPHLFTPTQYNHNHDININLVMPPTLYVSFINKFINNTTYLIQRIWQVTNTSKTRKRYFQKVLQSNFTKRPRRFEKSRLWVRVRGMLFATKRALRDTEKQHLNFLWQKKKLYWSSKQRSYLQFFSKFMRLNSTLKSKFAQTENALPTLYRHVSTFPNYQLSNLQLTQKTYKSTYVPNYVYTNVWLLSSQTLRLFLTNPWLITPLVSEVQLSTTLGNQLNKLQLPYSTKNSNLVPHMSFQHIMSKKILSLFSTNKIREDLIPFYYNTLIRFMEHCSGKKVMLQIYPFLNQNISYDFVVRYKSWITRMKSYERRLGHKFFFEEALHIMHLSFILRDAVLFSSWLKAIILRISFWKTRTIFRFLRYLFLIYFMHIFPELKIRGLKIRLKGKISAAGNSRKRTILYRVGETSHSKLNLRVSHSKQTINTFTGVMGFQVWLFY